MTSPARPSYATFRFPAEIISDAVWLYSRFPLSLRMVDELLVARGIVVSHEIVRHCALKFDQTFADQVRRRLPLAGDNWQLAIGRSRADDCRREALAVAHSGPEPDGAGHPGAEPARHAGRQAPAAQAAEAAMPGTSCHGYRQAGELRSDQAGGDALVEHRKHKGLNKRAENSHQLTRRCERQRKRFKSAGQAPRFLSAHDGINNLFHRRRDHQYRSTRTQIFKLGPRSPASPLRRNHDHDVLIARERDLTPTS